MSTRLELIGKIVMVLLLILTIPGCILIDLPLDRQRWGSLPHGAPGECPDLTGTFRVDGQATESRLLFWFLPLQWRRESKQEVRLDRDLRLLLDETRRRAVAIDHLSEVTFSWLNATHLQIMLHYEAESAAAAEPETLTFVAPRRANRFGLEEGTIEDRAYTFGCHGGMLQIFTWLLERPSREQSSRFRDLTRRLGRLGDGSLVVHVGEWDRRVPLLYYFWGSSWHRYEQVSMTGEPDG
jgi:hypothetical protein